MIVYFANRAMDILGLASTELPEGFHITDDTETHDVETGISSLECTVRWTSESRDLARKCTAVGNYMLKKMSSFESKYDVYRADCYTIIEAEEDTKDRAIYLYAESGGMDLINSVVGPYAATRAHSPGWYIDMFAENTGFEFNFISDLDLERKLEWTGEATVAERIASVATQFDNAEIEYRVEMLGLKLWQKVINIYKKRGDDNHVILRLNQEVDRIVTTTSIADLATALYVEGGIPEGEEDPITLEGYTATADGGDIYTDGDGIVKSKSALKTWSRYANAQEPYASGDGHIVKRWSYDTTSQSELFNRAVTHLQKIYTPAVNYEVDITIIPDDMNVGDEVYIVDEGGGLFLQSRVLQIQTSASNNKTTLTLGDYRLASDGLSTQVDSLTSQVASVRSQTVKTAATVDKLQSDVSSLKSSSVSSSSSVSVTLSNSYGSASGTLSFSSGMSLNLQYLFNSYALLSETAQIRLESNYGYAYGPFGFQSPLTLNIQNLLPTALSQLDNDCDYATRSDVSGLQSDIAQIEDELSYCVRNDQNTNITIKTSDASVNGNFNFESGAEIDISKLVSGGGSGGFVTNNEDSATWEVDGGATIRLDNEGLLYDGTRFAYMWGGGLWGFGAEGAGIIWHYGGKEVFVGRGIDDCNSDATHIVSGGDTDIFAENDVNIYAEGRVLLGYEANSMVIIGINSTSSVYIQGSAFNNSDKRLKTSIQPLNTSSLDNLTPVSFKWRDGDDRTHYGYIAQEVQPYFPELVSEGTDGMLGLAYTEIIPLLHCKIKAMDETIKTQQSKIESLEERISRLEALINENT